LKLIIKEVEAKINEQEGIQINSAGEVQTQFFLNGETVGLVLDCKTYTTDEEMVRSSALAFAKILNEA